MPYSVSVGATHPGLFRVLLDQSKSMEESNGSSSCSKAEAAAEAVNRVIASGAHG